MLIFCAIASIFVYYISKNRCFLLFCLAPDKPGGPRAIRKPGVMPGPHHVLLFFLIIPAHLVLPSCPSSIIN
ncbi:putative membrane protein [Shimwellia blattae DSM 4481 = NBRC 105725]|uniref:Putative membrane protein n=1 Tax=Shimwellia blattae (strain ATCC 29907 / DSM 4481 / JCM 1650 / NBRC 105725 / CDC 9005-74) TaxID=630626 RepID=I2BE23_SHIBC|nr:putative membrane protein [Shimwellia blattae DSM 4481 = NBRC 105725]